MAARALTKGSRFPNLGQWPRRWDARINLTVNTGATTDIPADPGRVYGFDCPGVIIPLGQWTGIEMSTLEAAVDFAPLQPGIPLPRKVRLRSTGASATAPQMTLAFWALSDEEQADLGGAMMAALASAAATLSGPFPPATPLSDADPNPTTTRVGADLLVWDVAGAQWIRGEAKVPAFNLAESGKALLETLALGNLWDSTKLTWGRAAMVRNSGGAANGGRAVVEDGWKNASQYATGIGTATTGTKLSYTCPANRVAIVRQVSVFNKVATAGVVMNLEVTPSGGAITMIITFTSGASLANYGTFASIDLGPGDFIQWFCGTAQIGTSADLCLWIEERDAE